MTDSNVKQFPKAPKFKQLQCPKCFASVEANCDCGVAYATPKNIVQEASKINPDISDRELARHTGVPLATVIRNRGSGDPNGSPEKRTGRDGKQYPAKGKAKKKKNPLDDVDLSLVTPEDLAITPADYRQGFMERVEDAMDYAYYQGTFEPGWGKEFAKLARHAAKLWSELADALEQEKTHGTPHS